ncbi:MAG: prepilin-type N-terminal cleavage/methylation domain-containing protein [Patescibacteria group bacterium]|nr:prepilin-type N-terminal cleavage/methylation domain-containing protein [Patescibacteria group bacterium]
MTKQTNEKGFTLIELIITIAILAVLVTVLVVAINPAEQLQRSRDTKRVGDLEALKTALNLYLAQATTTINLGGGNACVGSTTIRLYTNTTGAIATSSTFCPTCTTVNASTSQTVGAAGWMPARIDQTPGGAPISILPLDPTNGTGNSGTYYYSYICDVTGGVKNYELGATLESTYFTSDLDIDGTDGGNQNTRYEVGTDPNLDL